MMKRFLIPAVAFSLGSGLIAGFYIGVLSWLQDWEYAASQFARDRWYVLPIIVGFGIQAVLYSILRFRLFIPVTTTGRSGALIGTSGTTSATTMVVCCLHRVTDVLPILGLSAGATFLIRYQRPLMLFGLGMNMLGILVMLIVLYRERQKILTSQLVLETK